MATHQARAAIDRRASGAAGTHDPRPNRERARRQARRAAIRRSLEAMR